MDELIPMRDEGWMKFTVRFIVFYLLLAVANEVVWRSWGTDTWVNFRTFVLPAANFLFIMAQVPLFQRYAVADGRRRLIRGGAPLSFSIARRRCLAYETKLRAFQSRNILARSSQRPRPARTAREACRWRDEAEPQARSAGAAAPRGESSIAVVLERLHRLLSAAGGGRRSFRAFKGQAGVRGTEPGWFAVLSM